MCFSAEASFISGVAIASVGVVSLRIVKTNSHKLFATIPIVFGIQQIIEGFLWLALKGKLEQESITPLTYGFIFIAQIIWPIWVPYSIYLMEQKAGRKKLFWGLIGIGAAISLTVCVRLLFYPLTSAIVDHHIVYSMKFPVLIKYLGAAGYFIATVVPTFASSVKRMHFLGILILISYVTAAIFFTKYAISVWCFFAAVISMVIYIIVKKNAKSDGMEKV